MIKVLSRCNHRQLNIKLPKNGSSHPEVFCKKGVLFFDKVAGLIKKETLAQVFSCDFVIF